MRMTAKVLATALAAAGLALAQGAMADSGRGQGVTRATSVHGGYWHGGHGGYYRGGHYYGGYYRGWYPSFGFAFGVPIYWGPSWGWYDYPRQTVVYREVMPQGYMPGYMESLRELSPEERAAADAAQAQAPAAQAPAPEARNPLGASYCASARAYYPAVRNCPEGWSFSSPTR